MARSVVVKLEAQVGDYIVPIVGATEATEKLDDKIKQTNEDVGKVEPASRRAAAAMKLLGAEAGQTKLKLNDLGPGATNALQLIDQRLETTRANVRKLADEFNRTGDVNSLSLWQAASKDLVGLERLKSSLASALGDGVKKAAPEAEKEISGWLSRASNSFVNGVSNIPWVGVLFKPFAFAANALPPQAQVGIAAAVAGAIAAGASFIGAAFNGALLAGVGLGGIALGIVGQLHNAAVVAAFSRFKSDAMAALTGATSAFGPALATSISTAREGLVAFLAAIKPGLNALAPVLDRLVTGLVQGLIRAAPEFVTAFKVAAVVLNQLARDLPGLIHTVGDFFAIISGGSAGATDGLHALIVVIEGLILTTAVLIRGLTESFHALSQAVDVLTGNMGGLLGRLGDTGKASDAAKQAIAGMATASRQLGDELGGQIGYWDRLNAQLVAAAQNFDRVFGITMSVQQATDGLASSVNNLADSVAQNGKVFEGNSKQALANRDAIRQQEQAILAVRDANVAAGMSVDDANQKYLAQQDALRKQLATYGLTTQQINDLIGAYAKVPAEVSTVINTPGLGSASGAVSAYKNQLDNIPRSVATQFLTMGPSSRSASNQYALGGIRRAASGMIIPPRDPGTLVGEPQTGGEALIPLQGISQMRAAGLGQVAMSGYGLDVVPRGWSGPQTLQLAATFVLPSGEVVHKQLITYALNTGRQPSQLFPAAAR